MPREYNLQVPRRRPAAYLAHASTHIENENKPMGSRVRRKREDVERFAVYLPLQINRRNALNREVLSVAESDFKVGSQNFNAGSFIVRADGNSSDLKSRLQSAVEELGLNAYAFDQAFAWATPTSRRLIASTRSSRHR